MSCHWHFKLPPCDELGLVACLMCILSLPFDSDSNIRSSETLSMNWNISGGDISTDDLDPLPTVLFLWARKLIIFSRSWTLPIRKSSEDGYAIVEMIYRSSILQQYHSGRKFTLFSLNQGHMFGHWLCRGSSNVTYFMGFCGWPMAFGTETDGKESRNPGSHKVFRKSIVMCL